MKADGVTTSATFDKNLFGTFGHDANIYHKNLLQHDMSSPADMAWVLHEKLYGQYWMKKWEKLPTPTKKRVLILMCCTGGGHKASATALSEALTELAEPDSLDISIVDVFVEHTNFPFNRFPSLYAWFANRPRIWEAVYKTTKMTARTPLGWEEPLALAWCVAVVSVTPAFSMIHPPSPTLSDTLPLSPSPPPLSASPAHPRGAGATASRAASSRPTRTSSSPSTR